MTLTPSEALAFAAILLTIVIAWRSEAATSSAARLLQVKESATQRAESQAAVAALNSAVAEIKIAIAHLDKIPVMESQIKTVLDVVAGHGSRLETVWLKLFSHDKHIAVLRESRPGSSPDLSGE